MSTRAEHAVRITFIVNTHLCGWPLFWIPFKLYLVVIQPILKPVSFSNKFGKLVCIIDSLNKGNHSNMDQSKLIYARNSLARSI